MFYYRYDPTYLLLIPGLLLALYAQIKVSDTYSKWKRVSTRSRMTGAEMARMILDGNGCGDVRIERVAGKLTDHYDPQDGVLRLSNEVYSSDSVAAIGIAAHEAGHAIQDAQSYAPMRIRAALVPVANIGSNAAIPLFMLGLIFSWQPLLKIGILCFALAVHFRGCSNAMMFVAVFIAASVIVTVPLPQAAKAKIIANIKSAISSFFIILPPGR